MSHDFLKLLKLSFQTGVMIRFKVRGLKLKSLLEMIQDLPSSNFQLPFHSLLTVIFQGT